MVKSKRVKFVLLLSVFLFLIVFLSSALGTRNRTMNMYQSGIMKLEEGSYQEAIEILENLGDYRDSYYYVEAARNCIKKQEEENVALYSKGAFYFAREDYMQALSIFEQLNGYSDSETLTVECRTRLKRLALSATVSAGVRDSASITADGHVTLVGENFRDISIIKDWDKIISVSVGSNLVAALKSDGTVVTAKRNNNPYRFDTSGWTDIIALSVGEEFIIGLKADGTLVAQGLDSYGETSIENWKDIIAIDTGWYHTVGLDKNGELYIAGRVSNLKRSITENRDAWKDIIAISTGGGALYGVQGSGHIVALRKDGRVVAVGDNSYGQCNVTDWHDIIAISAGDYHTIGLTSDGHVLTTQTKEDAPDSYAEISSWENIVAISAGYGFTLGLKDDGTVVAAGFSNNGQWDTTLLSGAIVRDEWGLVWENIE